MAEVVLVLVNYVPEMNEVAHHSSPIYVANEKKRTVSWWEPMKELEDGEIICKPMLIAPPPDSTVVAPPDEVGYIKTGAGLRLLNTDDIRDIVFRSSGLCYAQVDDENYLVLHNKKAVLLKRQ